MKHYDVLCTTEVEADNTAAAYAIAEKKLKPHGRVLVLGASIAGAATPAPTPEAKKDKLPRMRGLVHQPRSDLSVWNLDNVYSALHAPTEREFNEHITSACAWKSTQEGFDYWSRSDLWKKKGPRLRLGDVMFAIIDQAGQLPTSSQPEAFAKLIRHELPLSELRDNIYNLFTWVSTGREEFWRSFHLALGNGSATDEDIARCHRTFGAWAMIQDKPNGLPPPGLDRQKLARIACGAISLSSGFAWGATKQKHDFWVEESVLATKNGGKPTERAQLILQDWGRTLGLDFTKSP